LRILNLNFFFARDEFEMATMFEIPFNKLHFPVSFITEENINYVGHIPLFNYFEDGFDSPMEQEDKKAFFDFYKKNNLCWSFSREIEAFNDQRNYLLTLSALKFINESFNFQTLIQKSKDL